MSNVSKWIRHMHRPYTEFNEFAIQLSAFVTERVDDDNSKGIVHVGARALGVCIHPCVCRRSRTKSVASAKRCSNT
jgi:hypothetical protein